MIRQCFARTLFLAVAIGSAFGSVTPVWAEDAAAPEEPSSAEDLRKRQAREAFERGLEQFRGGATDDALAEFLRSRELFPTRNATLNAAGCLQILGRFVDALAMYDALIDEFPNLPPEDRATAERARAELRKRIGVLFLSGGEPGAIVVVDGKDQGPLPLTASIRLKPGSHVVRVYKPKFLPFEATVTLTEGGEEHIDVHLVPLGRMGQLRVVEASGARADVFVDGIKVGQTPWEGPVSLGVHTVTLRRAAEQRGTQPVVATVTSQKAASLSLTMEVLPCMLRIESDPPDTAVILDGVQLPLGVWEGPVRAGMHVITGSAEGYANARQNVELRPGAQEVIKLELDRPTDSTVVARGKPFIETGFAGLLGPSFHGEIQEGCIGSQCDSTVMGGGSFWIGGGYRSLVGFDLGLSIGYLGLRQTITDRPAGNSSTLLLDDTISLHGVMVGIRAGYNAKTRFPSGIRFGWSIIPSWVGDQRTGSQSGENLVPAYQSVSALFTQVSLEVYGGFRIDKRLELLAGADGSLLLPLVKPVWDTRQDVAVGNYIFRFPPETMVGEVAPAVGGKIFARYTFN